MDKQNIDEGRKREIQKQTIRITFILAAVVVLYAVYGIVTKSMNPTVFEILLGIFVVGYSLLTDVVEPYRLGMLQEMSIGQQQAFLKIIAADVVGVGALMYWIVGMDSDSGNSILVPVLIYFLSVQMKRKFHTEFVGVEEEEEKEEEKED